MPHPMVFICWKILKEGFRLESSFDVLDEFPSLNVLVKLALKADMWFSGY